jgi:hypothetical protein
VTLTALGTVRIDALDTHNAPGLTVQGPWTIRNPAVINDALPVVRIRSDDVRIIGLWCDGVGAPCIGASRPQHRVVIDSVTVHDAPSGVIARGSDWLVTNVKIGPLTSGTPENRIGISLQGSRMVARGNQVIGEGGDLPNGTCLLTSSQDDKRIVLDNNLCVVVAQGLRIAQAGQLIVQHNQFGFTGVAITSFATGGEILLQGNFVTANPDGCGVALRAAGATVHVRGNLFLSLSRAYCAQTLQQASLEGNLLQVITNPEPGPGDIVEDTLPPGVESLHLIARLRSLRHTLR